MTEYLIAFNDEWVPDHTLEELREKSNTNRALVAETPVFSVDASSGEPLFTDGPYLETKEHLGGFLVVDVPDEASARYWAGRVAVACGWTQEVRPFPDRDRFVETEA